ncbi:MAG: hypothetical protein OXC02_07635 [Rhodobacteraceae bacterium]|nr:hypothetical protein [Paracoccaceae bacterium]
MAKSTSTEPQTTFKVIEGLGMILFRGDINSEEVIKRLTDIVGIEPPKQIQITTTDTFSIGWMAPDELLMFFPSEQVEGMINELNKGFVNSSVLIHDVSNSRSIIELSGSFIRDIIAKNTPVDLAKSKFTKGTFRRTRYGQVACAFWCLEETHWYMICRRSETEYVLKLLYDSANPESLPVFFS